MVVTMITALPKLLVLLGFSDESWALPTSDDEGVVAPQQRVLALAIQYGRATALSKWFESFMWRSVQMN